MDNKQQDAICVAISTKLKERAKEFAKKKGLSLNALVRLALTEIMERDN